MVKVKNASAKPKAATWEEASNASDAGDAPAPAPLKKSKKAKAAAVKPTIERPSKKSVKSVTETDDAKDHKSSLNKLKEIDPEFYKYLEQNDKKLLKFDADAGDSNDEDDDGLDDNENDEDEDDDSDDERGGKLHKPTGELEAASDESDFEDDDNTARKSNSVTLKLLKEWQTALSGDKVSIDVIKNVIDALSSALLSVAGESANVGVYRVEGAAAFNGVIQLCVLHLHAAIRRFLGLNQTTSVKPHKCKKWNKVKSSLRGYLIDITKLLEHVSSANVLCVLLKHLHQISPMISSFSTLSKPILKRLVTLWSTGEETVRVLAFLCILRITRDQQAQILSIVLKAMYLSYVRNSKFVSPGTLPGINFMRRSLTEMFALDLNVSYQHVFLYIRQLAIHLRNAITLKKKDSLQSVYNWQYINSIRLWAELLSATYSKAQLQPLVYPLISIITGAIKLIPTAQFFPLRFHLIQALIQLSKGTRTFIPVLPFILEVFHSNAFNKKHAKVSMKPLQFTCILRLNKNQMLENGFRDETAENVFSTILDYMAHESYSIAYPDLAVTAIVQLKQYLKNGKNINPNHSRKLKSLCDKLEENARFVEAEREKFNFSLKDTSAINAWETTLRNKGTPLLTFYNNWVQTHLNAQKRKATQGDNAEDFHMPTSLKRKLANKEKADGPVELFPSDDEDEDLEVERSAKKQKKKKQREAENKHEDEGNGDLVEDEDVDNESFTDEGVDIVKDLDMDEW